MKDKAIENFTKNGYSCSEAIVKAAADKGVVNQNLIPLATPFSGAMGAGCLCGAISGMQLVIGALKGRHNSTDSPADARKLANYAIEKFKERHKATCCRVLSAGFEAGSIERKQNCCKFVSTCAEILEEIANKQTV